MTTITLFLTQLDQIFHMGLVICSESAFYKSAMSPSRFLSYWIKANYKHLAMQILLSGYYSSIFYPGDIAFIILSG